MKRNFWVPALLVFFLLSCINTPHISEDQKKDSINNDQKIGSFVYPIKNINVYDHKGVSQRKVLAQVKCGEPLKINATENYWHYIELNDGRRGWVQDYLVRYSKKLTTSECEKLNKIELQEQEQQTSRSSSIKANVGDAVYALFLIRMYELPNLSSAIVYEADHGDKLYIITKNPDWTKVKAVTGEQGWVANKWITEDYEKVREYVEKRENEKRQKAVEEELERKAELTKDAQRKETIIEIENVLKTIPSTDYERNYNLYRQLQNLEPDNALYKEKTNYYFEKKNKAVKQKKEHKIKQKKATQIKNEKEKLSEGYVLKLNGWHWEESYGYVKAIGSVKNISNKKIERLRVVVSWFDKDNNLITYDTSYVEYTALMPGQTTPFTIMESYNPRMKKAQINFILESGNTPLWYTD